MLQQNGTTSMRSLSSAGDLKTKIAFDSMGRGFWVSQRCRKVRRSVEGYLFPDTYCVWKDQPPEKSDPQVVAHFAAACIRLPWHKPRARRMLQYVVILASIIEKEFETPADRRMSPGFS